MMIGKKLKRNVICEINIGPVICLLIVLWVIQVWLISPHIRSNKLEVSALEKLSYDVSSVDNNPNWMVVKLDSYGNIYLNCQKISREKLINAFYNYCKDNPKERRIVYLKASKKLNYEYVCNFIDDIKGSGIVFIKLQIDYLEN
jgi:biopolymer transport protein ExbD